MNLREIKIKHVIATMALIALFLGIQTFAIVWERKRMSADCVELSHSLNKLADEFHVQGYNIAAKQCRLSAEQYSRDGERFGKAAMHPWFPIPAKPN